MRRSVMARYAMAAALIVTLVVDRAWVSQPAAQQAEGKKAMNSRVTIKVGGKPFTATLADNATAAALAKLLPLSITMTELNGNEKLFRLSHPLPTQEFRPSSIHAGDVMLYGSSTLVLFYKSFPTSYSYTRIGRVDDPTGLDATLGPGDAAVVIEAASRP